MGGDYSVEKGIQPLEPKDQYNQIELMVDIIGEAYFNKTVMKEKFSQYDKNKTGLLEPEEVRELLIEKYKEKMKTLQEVIDGLKERHPDATEFINEHEVKMENTKKIIDKISDKVDGFMAKYDKNKDQKISFDEFLVYFQREAAKIIIKGSEDVEEDLKLMKIFQEKLKLFLNDIKPEDIQSQIDEIKDIISFFFVGSTELRKSVREKKEKNPQKIQLANYFYLANLFSTNLEKDFKREANYEPNYYRNAKLTLEKVKIINDVTSKIVEILEKGYDK